MSQKKARHSPYIHAALDSALVAVCGQKGMATTYAAGVTCPWCKNIVMQQANK